MNTHSILQIVYVLPTVLIVMMPTPVQPVPPDIVLWAALVFLALAKVHRRTLYCNCSKW